MDIIECHPSIQTPIIGLSGKRICLQCRRCRRHGFDPWVGKIPRKRAWQPTPACLPEKSNRGVWWATIHRVTRESDRTEATEHTSKLKATDLKTDLKRGDFNQLG